MTEPNFKSPRGGWVCHEATLTLHLPNGKDISVPVLWSESGSIIPAFSSEEDAALLVEIDSDDGDEMEATVSLEAAPEIKAAVDASEERGFFTDSRALLDWAAGRSSKDA